MIGLERSFIRRSEPTPGFNYDTWTGTTEAAAFVMQQVKMATQINNYMIEEWGCIVRFGGYKGAFLTRPGDNRATTVSPLNFFFLIAMYCASNCGFESYFLHHKYQSF